jgi:phosphohistidine phosphatase
MQILLMQHGEALSKEINPEQPLSPVGRDHVARTGRFLQTLGLNFTAILCSPKARAQETASLIAEAVGFPANRITASEAFKAKAAPQDSAEALRSFEGDTRVLVAGHLPNLPQLAAHLLTRGPAFDLRFENAGLTCLEAESPAVRNAALVYHLPPRFIQMVVGA